MSIADEIYRQNCLDILEHGFSDAGQQVRPRWAGQTERLPTPLSALVW